MLRSWTSGPSLGSRAAGRAAGFDLLNSIGRHFLQGGERGESADRVYSARAGPASQEKTSRRPGVTGTHSSQANSMCTCITSSSTPMPVRPLAALIRVSATGAPDAHAASTGRDRQASAGATARPARSSSAAARRIQVMAGPLPKPHATAAPAANQSKIAQNGPCRTDRPAGRAGEVFGSGQWRVAHGQRTAVRERLARMETWIGTSGYNYPEWKGHFYPADLPAAKMLPFYAARFRTVEINYTF